MNLAPRHGIAIALTYSNDELIAELGAAMLCGVTGIEKDMLENNAAYLQTWIGKLKSDSKLIISAASQAQKAADYILGTAGIAKPYGVLPQRSACWSPAEPELS